jgi:hypothetical protein
MSSEKRLIKPNPLGQRGSALEEEAGTPIFQAIEQGIQRPTDPEVLLDILRRRAEAQRRRIEGAQHRIRAGRENFVESRVHVFVVPVAPRLEVRLFALGLRYFFNNGTQFPRCSVALGSLGCKLLAHLVGAADIDKGAKHALIHEGLKALA